MAADDERVPDEDLPSLTREVVGGLITTGVLVFAGLVQGDGRPALVFKFDANGNDLPPIILVASCDHLRALRDVIDNAIDTSVIASGVVQSEVEEDEG